MNKSQLVAAMAEKIEIQANGKGICPYCEGRLSIFGKKCKSCGKSY